MIGEVVASYRVVRVLGEGGMGVVYYAEHVRIGTKAAVKVLHAEYSQREEIVRRFFNEARAAALIDHPGMVQVFDFGTHPAGFAYLVMEYLSGESLASFLRREGAVSLDVLRALTRQIAGALGAAHAAGIVHRDLKPDNVYLVPDAGAHGGIRVKILDFGIAKLESSSPGVERTRTGAVMGTPSYMSPEQCRGASNVDGRSDVYALGCILYEMACGQRPFRGELPGDIIAAHMRDAPPPPTTVTPAVPEWLEATILRAMAKRPEERPQTMAELVTWLDGVAPPPPAEPAALGGVGTEETAVAVSTTLGATDAQSTTLGAANGDSQRTASRPDRGRWRAALALGVIAFGGVTAAGLLGGSDEARRPATATATATATAPTTTTSSVPIAAGPAHVVDDAPVDAGVRAVVLQFIVTPADARYRIEVDGRTLTAPEVEVPMSRTRRLDVRVVADGYQPFVAHPLPVSDLAIPVELVPARRPARRTSDPTEPRPPPRVKRVDDL